MIETLKKYRFNLATEQLCKDEMEQVMIKHKLPYKREYRLDKKNIPDFFNPEDGMAIEVKLKCPPMEALRQCERYASFDQVKSILLVTNKAHGFPEAINGKPVYVIRMGQAWL